MTRRTRMVALIASAAVSAMCASTSTAGAAVTVGATFAPDQDFGGAGVFIQKGSPGNTYAVPADGVITKWSFQAPPGITPALKLKVVRSAGGTDYATVGDSQAEPPTPIMLNTWPTQIPVKQGDLIGNAYSDSTVGYRNGVGYNTAELCCDDPVLDPPPGTTASYHVDSGDYQIDVSAVLEADADQDGFGDETQDQCPTVASAQGPCPLAPATHVKKKCGKKKHKHSAASAKKKHCKKKK
jgi:hypothetical protein